MRKLRTRFEHAVHLEWEPDGGRATSELKYSEAIRGRSDLEIASTFVADCRGAAPNESEQALLTRALEEAGKLEAVGPEL